MAREPERGLPDRAPAQQEPDAAPKALASGGRAARRVRQPAAAARAPACASHSPSAVAARAADAARPRTRKSARPIGRGRANAGDAGHPRDAGEF